MRESPTDRPPPNRGHTLHLEPTRARERIGAPGQRRILAQSARAIARSRELEARVKRLEARFRTSKGRVGETADAALVTLAARRSAHALTHRDLVAAVSYDLRTPLQAILGYAELLVAGASGEFTETREFARRIVVSGLSLAQVVENLIELSAAQLGPVPLDIRPFDVQRLMADVVRLADPLARHKGIVLRADLVPFEMTSDRRRVRQVATNLVEHAIGRTDSGEVVVRLAAAGAAGRTTAAITVRDSGPAIDAADVSDAFASFPAGPTPVPSPGEDPGLALSTVRHLARLLGGEVRTEAGPSGGNTITVELPRVAPATEALAG
jgi:signal transduction histidine kinase